MKITKRILAFILIAATLTGIFSGCASTPSGSDPILSKGEFMLLFVSETEIGINDASQVSINMDPTSEFYDAARAIVNMGYASAEDVVKDVDKGVTKEFVATVCVRNLYFRETADVELKDADKLSDPQACKDAVGHQIVTTERGYFDANQEMTYQQCQAAIDRMLEIDANGRFEKDDLELDVELKEGVLNLDEYFTEDEISAVEPDDPNFQEIADLFANSQPATRARAAGVNARASYCSSSDAEEDDVIIIRVLAHGPLGNSNYEKLKVGDYMLFGVLKQDMANNAALGTRLAIGGEILAIQDGKDRPDNALMADYVFYTVRVASNDEIINSAKINGYSSSSQSDPWGLEELSGDIANAEAEFGLDIGKVTLQNGELKLTVKQTLENEIESWREAKRKVDLTYELSVKDIDLTCDGWGSVFSGNIDNAVFKVDYTVVNKLTAESSFKVAPDNNRNGKFFNNLKRSRLTDSEAAGADGIKIARLYLDIGYGFFVELYVYLTVKIDGSISITITTDCSRGIQVKNNKVTTIKDKSTSKELNVNINVELGVNFQASLKWGRRKSKALVDATLSFYCDIFCTADVFVLDDAGENCIQQLKNTFLTDLELKEDAKDTKLEWCFNISRQYSFEISGLSKNSRAGQIIRLFDKDFNLSTGKIPLGDSRSWHWEDGSRVSECTRDHEIDEDTAVIDGDSSIVFETYALTVPDNICAILDVSVNINGITDMAELMKDTASGGVRVYSTDPSIAEVSIVNGYIMIDCKKPGATTVVMETNNKRHKQTCSVLVLTPEEYEEETNKN